MSCKTKFGPCDNWLTTKWDVYPIIKNKNKIKLIAKSNHAYHLYDGITQLSYMGHVGVN